MGSGPSTSRVSLADCDIRHFPFCLSLARDDQAGTQALSNLKLGSGKCWVDLSTSFFCEADSGKAVNPCPFLKGKNLKAAEEPREGLLSGVGTEGGKYWLERLGTKPTKFGLRICRSELSW